MIGSMSAVLRRIRRTNEDGTGLSHYLSRSHDPAETALIGELLRRNEQEMRALAYERQALLRLAEMDERENRMHREDLEGHRSINQALAQCEQPEMAEPPVEAAVLAS